MATTPPPTVEPVTSVKTPPHTEVANVEGGETIEATVEGEEPEEDEFEADELDEASVASTSVTSSIYRHHFENGRRYHRYRHGRYPLPNDDTEQGREEMKHALHMELTNGKLFLAPLGDNPQKIIDLGTGTGIWAMEVADAYPSAEVLGTDLSPIQSSWVPPNVRFLIDDIEDDWLNGSDFDFIHMRSVVILVKDVPKLLQRCITHLRPGGWIEIQDYAPEVLSDDDSLGDSAMAQFTMRTAEGLAKFGLKNYLVPKDLRSYLEEAGFVNIQLKSIKAPIGTWPKDKRLRLCGMYMRQNMYDFLNIMAAKPLLSVMSKEEAQLLAAQARKNINDPGHHAYFNYLFWTAQKPE
ncbi:S-adenosyl-L-methionine-dependent methyltransferase [Thozetella sp. PMI_491]|nr:S-adenosyl-L-methionine-dependent methyltransferase [Thozetella sp. PMI_491]